MAKLIYIAHQVSGDIKANVKSILEICREIHTSEIIPFAPYLVALQYLDDTVSEERELGIKANRECFRRGIIDEVWVCGPKISKGMKKEVKLALENNIPIYCYNPSLQPELDQLIAQYRKS